MNIQILSSITDATTPTGTPSAHEIKGASAVVDAVDVKVTIPGSTRSDLPTYQNQVREKLVEFDPMLKFKVDHGQESEVLCATADNLDTGWIVRQFQGLLAP